MRHSAQSVSEKMTCKRFENS